LLLKNYVAFRITDMAALAHIVTTVASGRVIKAEPIRGKTSVHVHKIEKKCFSMFYTVSTLSSVFEFEPVDFIRLVFPIEGPCEVKIGAKALTIPRNSAYIMPNRSPASEYHPDGYRSLSLRIDPECLRRRLATLLGEETVSEVCFDARALEGARFTEFVRQPLFAAARELNYIPPPFLDFYLAELEARTLTSLIFHGSHNFTDRLVCDAPHIGFKNLARVEDYIQANWNRTLTLDVLTNVAQVSGKTLCQQFIKKHDMTPSHYIRHLRLQKANAMLKSTPSPSVVSIALLCGFSSLGHFARAYRQTFGELPSDTLKRR
jgi:AraC-like DNA-binding protein